MRADTVSSVHTICQWNYETNKMITIIIYPTVALIADQVLSMRENGIKVFPITGKKEFMGYKKKDIIESLVNGEELGAAAILTTPESLLGQAFRPALEKLIGAEQIAAFILDEAHCLSLWGAKFRRFCKFDLPYIRRSVNRLMSYRSATQATQRTRPYSSYRSIHCNSTKAD